MSTQFMEIALSAITPNPDNPRKTFDEKAVAELAESIKSKGVLQPIVVRPKGEGYEIVCGERRFRASKLAGLDRIPTTVRELSDEDALELMLMENFQRQDVHPMEEALGFEALTRISKLTVKDMAARVGKSWHYVADRLKLVKLIPELQPYFYEGKFNLTTAVNIAAMSEEVQREFLEDRKKDTWLEDWSEDENYFKAKRLSLSDAPFDTADENLIPDRGACSGCAFNTASSQLFPELEGQARCLNSVCFNKKKEAALKKAIDAALAEGMPICVGYYISEAMKPVIKGVPYVMSGGYEVIEEPVRKHYFEDTGFFFGDPDAEEEWESEEDWKEQFDENEARYQEDEKFFKLAMKNGKNFTKSLRIESDLSWKYVMAQIIEKDDTKPSKAFLSDVKVKDVVAKIESGKEKASMLEISSAAQKACDELETTELIRDEKIFEQVKKLFNDIEDEEGDSHTHPVLLKFGDLHPFEEQAAVFVMLDKMGFAVREPFLSDFLQEDISDIEDLDDIELVKRVLETVSFSAFRNAWLRWFINNEINFSPGNRSHNTGDSAKIFIQFAHHHAGGEENAIMNEMNEKYQKRIDTLKAQIERLNAEMDALKSDQPKSKTKNKK